ncbi:MAG: hypothetical protein ABIJ09_12735 [Pseudomonadota bacterium]
MPKLADVLLVDGKRPQVVRDCCVFLDEEVASKKGAMGLIIKGGFKMVKALKPGLIAEAFEDLLDPFVEKLEPFYSQHKGAGGGNFTAYISPRASEVAEALLGITDARAARAENKTIKKTYEKLRPYGKKNVVEAVPGIGRLIDKHA